MNRSAGVSQPIYRGALPLAFVVAALATLAPFSIDTYLPSFPDIGHALQASHTQMQYTLSLYMLASDIATLIYGPLSDGFGRRRVIMSALLIYIVASLCCALAATIDELIWLRIAQGISAGAGMAIGRAMVRDVFEGAEAQRVMARVMLLFSVAPAVAPLIGGWLHDIYGWHSVFLFLALLAAAMLLMVWHGTHETLAVELRQSVHPVAVARAYAAALGHRSYLAIVASFSLVFSGFFIYVASSPVVIYDFLGLAATDFWIMFVPSVAAIVIGSQLAGMLAGRMGQRSIVLLGLAIMLLASLVNVLQSLWLPAAPFNVIAPLALYVAGMAISMPNMNLMALDCFPHHRGLASALMSFAQMAVTALVIGVVAPMVSQALPMMAAAMLVLSMAGMLAWSLVRHRV